MINSDMLERTRWQELIDFFSQGEPPLALKLLILNTIFLIIFIFSRARSKNRMRSTTVYSVQALLISLNFAVMFATNLFPGAKAFKNLF